MWDDDDNKGPTPPGESANITLRFHVDYAFNMRVADIAEFSLKAEAAVKEVLHEAGRKYELSKYGSLSQKLTFEGVEVTRGRG